MKDVVDYDVYWSVYHNMIGIVGQIRNQVEVRVEVVLADEIKTMVWEELVESEIFYEKSSN